MSELGVLEILSIVALSIGGIASLILLNNFVKNPSKSKRKTSTKDEAEQFLNQKIKQMQELYEGQISALKHQLNVVNGKANRYQKINADLKAKLEEQYDEEEEEEQGSIEDLLKEYDIDFNKAREVGTSLGLNVDNFNLSDPVSRELLTSQILEHKDLAIATGVLKRRGQNTGQSTGNQPDFVDSTIEEIIKQGGQIA